MHTTRPSCVHIHKPIPVIDYCLDYHRVKASNNTTALLTDILRGSREVSYADETNIKAHHAKPLRGYSTVLK